MHFLNFIANLDYSDSGSSAQRAHLPGGAGFTGGMASLLELIIENRSADDPDRFSFWPS